MFCAISGVLKIFITFPEHMKGEIQTASCVKAAELAGILEGKTIFYVKIETPNDQESIDEITLERQQGIAYRVDGIRIIFTAGRPTMQANR